jgi:hypothetical protein
MLTYAVGSKKGRLSNWETVRYHMYVCLFNTSAKIKSGQCFVKLTLYSFKRCFLEQLICKCKYVLFEARVAIKWISIEHCWKLDLSSSTICQHCTSLRAMRESVHFTVRYKKSLKRQNCNTLELLPYSTTDPLVLK